ncbi:MAG: helix-turn-helix transcriptional regulator [Thermomicrobiales bacterium]
MALLELLSPRERDVLRLLSQGLTNRAIAGRLHVALDTIRWHAKNIYSKLGATNRTQATALAQRFLVTRRRALETAPPRSAAHPSPRRRTSRRPAASLQPGFQSNGPYSPPTAPHPGGDTPPTASIHWNAVAPASRERGGYAARCSAFALIRCCWSRAASTTATVAPTATIAPALRRRHHHPPPPPSSPNQCSNHSNRAPGDAHGDHRAPPRRGQPPSPRARSPSRRRRRRRSGRTIHGDATGGNWVILSNNGDGRQADWQPPIAVLAARGYTVLTYDWRGLGHRAAARAG